MFIFRCIKKCFVYTFNFKKRLEIEKFVDLCNYYCYSACYFIVMIGFILILSLIPFIAQDKVRLIIFLLFIPLSIFSLRLNFLFDIFMEEDRQYIKDKLLEYSTTHCTADLLKLKKEIKLYINLKEKNYKDPTDRQFIAAIIGVIIGIVGTAIKSFKNFQVLFGISYLSIVIIFILFVSMEFLKKTHFYMLNLYLIFDKELSVIIFLRKKHRDHQKNLQKVKNLIYI